MEWYSAPAWPTLVTKAVASGLFGSANSNDASKDILGFAEIAVRLDAFMKVYAEGEVRSIG